jgi:nucleoside 2-deoxyribosyltransferase
METCRGDKGKHTYVYISGPYSAGNREQNVQRALRAADLVEDRGFVVFVPHLNHFRHLRSPKPYAYWIRSDLAWLEKCDVLIRLPGRSPGADREVRKARQLGIPVVRTDFSDDSWQRKLEEALYGIRRAPSGWTDWELGSGFSYSKRGDLHAEAEWKSPLWTVTVYLKGRSEWGDGTDRNRNEARRKALADLKRKLKNILDTQQQ